VSGCRVQQQQHPQQFKAKAWIDVFGSRCAKGVGSIITGSSNGNPDVLVTYGRCAHTVLYDDITCMHSCACTNTHKCNAYTYSSGCITGLLTSVQTMQMEAISVHIAASMIVVSTAASLDTFVNSFPRHSTHAVLLCVCYCCAPCLFVCAVLRSS
jgi:hypothetical protein